MKKIGILLMIFSMCLSVCGLTQPEAVVMILKAASSTTTTTSGADSCDTNLLFSWHCENVDVDEGTPPGCVWSGADDAASAVNSPSLETTQTKDGTYACYYSGASEEYNFDWADDTIDPDIGTLDMWVYVSTFATHGGIFRLSLDGDNEIFLRMEASGGNKFQFSYEADGYLYQIYAEQIISPTPAWYHIIAQWDKNTAHDKYHLKICADTGTGTTNCNGSTSSLGTWAGSSGKLEWGDFSGWGGITYHDNIKIYNTWQ